MPINYIDRKIYTHTHEFLSALITEIKPSAMAHKIETRCDRRVAPLPQMLAISINASLNVVVAVVAVGDRYNCAACQLLEQEVKQ